MFTAEIRINSVLVAHVYGRQKERDTESGEHVYEYQMYTPENKKLKSGSVRHNREDGIAELVAKILLL